MVVVLCVCCVLLEGVVGWIPVVVVAATLEHGLAVVGCVVATVVSSSSSSVSSSTLSLSSVWISILVLTATLPVPILLCVVEVVVVVVVGGVGDMLVSCGMVIIICLFLSLFR